MREFLFQGAKPALCPAPVAGGEGAPTPSPQRGKCSSLQVASHPAQEPPLCSTGNLTPKILPKKVASLQGNRSHRRMSATYCQERFGRTGVTLPQAHLCLSPPSRTSDRPNTAVWGRGCHPPLSFSRSPASLLSPAPKPSLLRLSSLGVPAPKAALHILAAEGTQLPSPQHGGGHQYPPPLPLRRGRKGTLTHWVPAVSQAVALVPKATGPPGQPQHTTMATAGTQRGEEAAAAASGCDGGYGGRGDRDAQHPPSPRRGAVAACGPPAPAYHLPAQWRGDPESITRAQACQTASKAHSFSRELLPTYCCPRITETSCASPHLLGHRHWRCLASSALSQSSNSSSGKEYNDHSKHAVKLPPTLPPSFSTATAVCAIPKPSSS